MRLARIVAPVLMALLVLGTPGVAHAAPGTADHRTGAKHQSAHKHPAPRTVERPMGSPIVFNVASPAAPRVDKFRIMWRVVDAIEATSPTRHDPRPAIRIATYFLDWKPGVDALIAACRRGVGVQVILDGRIKNRQAKRLTKRLNADNVAERGDRPKTGPCRSALPEPPARPERPTRPKAPEHPAAPKKHTKQARRAYADDLRDYRAARRSYVKERRAFHRARHEYRRSLRTWKRQIRARKRAAKRYPLFGRDRSFVMKCTGNCRGGLNGNMHSKFFSFSHSGSTEKLVMVSSSNLNKGGALKGWNDLVAIRDKPKIYRKFQQVHRQMVHGTRASRRLLQVRQGAYTVRFFPLRRALPRKDPVLRDLDKIGCHSAFGRTRVHVSMFLWAGARGVRIARRLGRLGRAGCDVRVIYGAPTERVRLQLRKYAVNHVIRLYDSRRDFNPRHPGYELRTHGKYVLVKGTFAGDRRAYVVMTGSANWVFGSLGSNDEVTVNIARSDTWARYLKAWREVRRYSSLVPHYFLWNYH